MDLTDELDSAVIMINGVVLAAAVGVARVGVD